ncbi:MAG: tetratricopeptide repeat protein, partial [Acidobacteriota bacterium]
VLDGQRQIFGDEHPHVAVALQNLAAVKGRIGPVDEARRHWLACVDLRRRLHPSDHPALADALYGAARFHHMQRDLDAAEPAYREALAMRRALYGGDHPEVIRAELGVADLAWTRGELDDAARQYRAILARLEAAELGDTLQAGSASLQLGRTLARDGRNREALPWLRRARDIRAARLGPNHPQTRAADALLDETAP